MNIFTRILVYTIIHSMWSLVLTLNPFKGALLYPNLLALPSPWAYITTQQIEPELKVAENTLAVFYSSVVVVLETAHMPEQDRAGCTVRCHFKLNAQSVSAYIHNII